MKEGTTQTVPVLRYDGGSQTPHVMQRDMGVQGSVQMVNQMTQTFDKVNLYYEPNIE